MNAFTPETTVGAIAAGAPLASRIFEEAGIDFCCGGKVTLAEACAARGPPLGALIDHILVKHHAYLKAELPRLQALVEKLLTKHGERHGSVLKALEALLAPLREELDAHLMKEEMILFPLVRQLESGGTVQRFHCGSIGNPIRVMVMEHDSAGEALANFRELTGGYIPPEDVCNTFRAFYASLAALERDLHQHIHLENNILFPRAVELESLAPASV